MKHLNYFNITIGCIAFVLAYLAGYYVASNKAVKHYEAACLYADIIHYSMDGDSISSAEITRAYELFTEDIDSLGFKALQREDLEEYSWCY